MNSSSQASVGIAIQDKPNWLVAHPPQAHRRLESERRLPIDRVEAVIATKDLVLPDQTYFVWQVCDREPHWLDWALARLGCRRY
jgi:hypothetical protein